MVWFKKKINVSDYIRVGGGIRRRSNHSHRSLVCDYEKWEEYRDSMEKMSASPFSSIADAYESFGAELGQQLHDERNISGGAYCTYENGSIHFCCGLGAFFTHGAIREAWRLLGWEGGVLGFPVTHQLRASTDSIKGMCSYSYRGHGSTCSAPDSALIGDIAYISYFQLGAIYWLPADNTTHWIVRSTQKNTGDLLWGKWWYAQEVKRSAEAMMIPEWIRFGADLDLWSQNDWQNHRSELEQVEPDPAATIDETYFHFKDFLGEPLHEEKACPDGKGDFRTYENGSIHTCPRVGAVATHGAIRDAWEKLRWEEGPLGRPVTHEKSIKTHDLRACMSIDQTPLFAQNNLNGYDAKISFFQFGAICWLENDNTTHIIKRFCPRERPSNKYGSGHAESTDKLFVYVGELTR